MYRKPTLYCNLAALSPKQLLHVKRMFEGYELRQISPALWFWMV